MSSTNKTENLALNLWEGSDSPQRTDFNYDNEIIDKTVSEHTSNDEIHIDNEQRDKWNNFMYSGIYYGDGSKKRTITTECPFEVMVGFIYADDHPTSVYYAKDGSTHHYFSIISQMQNTYGAVLKSNYRDITVENTGTADIEEDYSNMNQVGVCYRYVLFRDNRE